MYNYLAKVVRWIDGDTVDMEVDLGFKISTVQRFRVLNVDTPEKGEEGYLRAKGIAEVPYPVDSVIQVSTFKPFSTDKYGRYLIALPLLPPALNAAGLNKLQ